jgi:N-methylhydantoinase A
MISTAFDIGGTFTDFVVMDHGLGTVVSGKVPTVPGSPAEGVLGGFDRLVPRLEDIGFAVHGTTVGLNAFLQRRGGRVLLVVTRGTRDVYHIARGHRRTMYDVKYRKPEPLVPLADIMEVGGRLSYAGEELETLSAPDVQRVVERLEREDFDSVAVAFLFSYVNPAHELAVEQALRDAVANVPVSLSHRVAPEWQEYERTSSTVLDAYVGGPVRDYLRDLDREVTGRGMVAPLHLMQSNGGILTAHGAARRPLQTFLSGPVGGVMGAAALADSLGRRNLICADMGGTSFDVSLVVDGDPEVAPELDLEGLPVLMPAVLIHTVGAGGGSLGTVQAGGLRVGPASAGAVPGPACYARGGTEPTVTDANLVLGRIDPDHFLGGDMALDVAAAERALARLGDELGLSVTELATGMLTVINAKMAQAIRTLTVEKGIEPRDFSLLAYGGAGPMHAAFIAEELEIPEVVVPLSPGTFSAWGMLQAPLRHDLSRMLYSPLGAVDGATVERAFVELEAEGRSRLVEEGAEPGTIQARRSIGLRYAGQEHTLDVTLDGVAVDEPDAGDAIAAAFHAAHEAVYGHSTPEAPIETVVLHAVVLGEVAGTAGGTPPAWAAEADARAPGRRPVVFDGAPVDTPVLVRGSLAPGTTLDGPAVVVEPTAVTVVPATFSLEVLATGELLLTAGR